MHTYIHAYIHTNPNMSRISLKLHKVEEKPRPSVNIKNVLIVQVEFNCHKGIMLLVLPLTCKGFQQFAFDVYQHFMA